MIIQELDSKFDNWLFFGGVYSNLQALQKFFKLAVKSNYTSEQIIFTGDSVAYCANPEECVRLLRIWQMPGVRGNMEEQLANGKDDCGCNFKQDGTCDRLSQQWYPYAKEKISADSISWMRSLPDMLKFSIGNVRLAIVHGSCSFNADYIFKSTPWNIKEKQFDIADCDIIIGGHCGLPFHNQKNGKLWINAGALGMPANDGTPRVWYLSVSHESDGSLLFKHEVFEYDHQKASEEMKGAGLPHQYSIALETGLWDNCEVLPEEETKQQGRVISEESFTYIANKNL